MMRLRRIGLRIGPRARRVEHVVRHTGNMPRHVKTEIGFLAKWNLIECAGERRAEQRARMGDRNSACRFRKDAPSSRC